MSRIPGTRGSGILLSAWRARTRSLSDGLLSVQDFRVMDQVVLHEGRDEVVAVVVAFMAPQLQRVTNFLRRFLEQVGMQLQLQELVRETLVDQDVRPARRILHAGHELGRIIGGPLPTVGTEIPCKRLLSP